MPITEVIFPLFKLDPESLAGRDAAIASMFTAMQGVVGIQNLVRGPLLEENGQPIDPNTYRSVISLGKPKFIY